MLDIQVVIIKGLLISVGRPGKNRIFVICSCDGMQNAAPSKRRNCASNSDYPTIAYRVRLAMFGQSLADAADISG